MMKRERDHSDLKETKESGHNWRKKRLFTYVGFYVASMHSPPSPLSRGPLSSLLCMSFLSSLTLSQTYIIVFNNILFFL